ncbi:hypothetical protein L9F63_002534 [Diploptera punctata]|uniref:Uncharacterized protein n=1 Tax=Diploptera punctata TaxID=6984 RepID=A0AAD7ZS14_DIPPU|nr:hypothetical protein L9F63_002534 [Diploptera punctata]
MPRMKKLPAENLRPDDEKEREEKVKRKRMIEAQKARERRANQTPEEVAARRMRDAQRARERRARLTAEQIAQQRQRDAILKRQRRAKETDAEKAIRRSLEAQKARERRAKLLGKKHGVETLCGVARMGLTHFMDLTDRADLGCDQNINNPLGISATGEDLAAEWANASTYIQLRSLDPQL